MAEGGPLTPPRGHCWFLGGEVAGPDQIRQQIQRNAAAGADVIKVMVSGGSMTPGGTPRWEPQFSTEEVRTAVHEAHRLGLPVAAHAHGTSSIRTCVDAGVDTIEHCTWLTGPGVIEPDEQTVTTANAMGLATTTGTLDAGYSADLLVVEGDPLADLTALQHPTLVLARDRPHILPGTR